MQTNLAPAASSSFALPHSARHARAWLSWVRTTARWLQRWPGARAVPSAEVLVAQTLSPHLQRDLNLDALPEAWMDTRQTRGHSAHQHGSWPMKTYY